jgi:hypothetical protein
MESKLQCPPESCWLRIGDRLSNIQCVCTASNQRVIHLFIFLTILGAYMTTAGPQVLSILLTRDVFLSMSWSSVMILFMTCSSLATVPGGPWGLKVARRRYTLVFSPKLHRPMLLSYDLGIIVAPALALLVTLYIFKWIQSTNSDVRMHIF